MKISTLRALFRHRRQIKSLISIHLYFLEHTDQSFWGSISGEDKTGIIENTKKAAAYPGPIVEIGALFGFTTQLIATHKPRDKALIAVENFIWNPFLLPPRHHQSFTERALYYCTKELNTQIFDGSNELFYNSYKGEKPAMVFIDADHTYEGVKTDIAWARKTRVPIISGHDYCDVHPGVRRAVDEAFGENIVVHGSVWTAT